MFVLAAFSREASHAKITERETVPGLPVSEIYVTVSIMKRPWWILVISAIFLWLWWWMGPSAAERKPPEWFLGSWTLVDGEGWSRIEFYQRPVPDSSPDDWIRGLEGHVKTVGIFSPPEQQGRWNYGYLEPMLGLNMMFGDESFLLLLQSAGENRMQARRLPRTAAPAMSLISHPETILLKRVGTD